MPLPPQTIDTYRASIGRELSVSKWFHIDQERIDRFAAITEDRQFIHVNREAAAASLYGATIAHGFLTLSMLTAMANSALAPISGAKEGVNYGLNNLRFLAPVRVGSRVRGCFMLKELSERRPGQWRSILQVTVEIERESKPALVAEWVTLTILS
jgi:acyl dehydratase